MKKSTKLYLQALILIMGTPFVFFALIFLLSKLSISKTDFGSVLSSLTVIIMAIGMIRGFFTLWVAKEVYEYEKKNPEIERFLIEANKNKEAFRNLIKNLCSIGIAKEIYRNDNFSVLNFNDLFYLLCPYFSIDNDEPYGIISSEKDIRKFINNYHLLLEFIVNIDNTTFSQMAISLKENNFENLVKYCKEHKGKHPSKHISIEFERELKRNVAYKQLGILCVCLPIVSFAAMFISELAGFLISVATIVISIKSINRSHKDYIKTDWKAVVGIIVASILILITIVALTKKIETYDTNHSFTSIDYLKPEGATEFLKQTPQIINYTTEIPYNKGTITDNVFHSEFISLYGRLPEGGYTWMNPDSLNDILPSVDWECGIKGLKSATKLIGLFTIYVGNDAGYEDCIAALENVNPDFTLWDVSTSGSYTIFTNMGFDDPYINNRRNYGKASFKNDNGIFRSFTLNKVNDRLVCVLEQYEKKDDESLSIFCFREY